MLFKSKNNEKRKGKIKSSKGLINKASKYLNKLKYVKYVFLPEEVKSKRISVKFK